MKAGLRRELKWFVGSFLAPMVVLIGLDLMFRSSPLPLWRRLLTLEDTCSYGVCFILPALLFVFVLGARTFVAAFQRFGRERANKSPKPTTPAQGDR